LALLCVSAIACSGADEEETTVVPPPLPVCDAPSLALPDGSCIRPGIPPDGCAEGFVHDGEYGCDPVLPEAPCAPGQMAALGETTCRPVMACGAGKWGDIPVEPNTQYVDGSFTGISTGSEQAPWKTITEAYEAAAVNAVIAVAEGTYAEDIYLWYKPARLWGVCPERVSLVGTGTDFATVEVRNLAQGSELHGMRISSELRGIAVLGSPDIVIDQVWVHQVMDHGIYFDDIMPPVSAVIRNSLVEDNQGIGIFVMGSEATIESTVVRGTQAAPGWGVAFQISCTDTCDLMAPASGTLRGSIVEDNTDLGVLVGGSQATLEGSVIRNTRPRAGAQTFGDGLSVQLVCDSELGVCFPETRARAEVRGSFIVNNHDMGIIVAGGDAIVENTVVRDTQPQASDQLSGRGMSFQLGCFAGNCYPESRSTAEVRSSLVEGNHDMGIQASGADVTIDSTVLRNTLPRASDAFFGRGLQIQISCFDFVCDPNVRGNTTLRGSLVEGMREHAIMVASSDATFEGVVVRGTAVRASDALLGDGITLFSYMGPAIATITNSRIADSARAGLSIFGATATLASTQITCASFPLDGEALDGQPFSLTDQGNNACGCPNADEPCRLVSSSLQPPDPL
jgi:hypothetical protein